MNKKPETALQNIKKTFFKKGPCSSAFFYILNQHFGHPHEEEERAAEPLNGGVLRRGYQCGMLWGASLAAGAEAFRRYNQPAEATAAAIRASQHIVKSFSREAKTLECSEVTHIPDISSGLGVAKYMLSGKFLGCFELAEKWAPQAVEAASRGLAESKTHSIQPESCASITARKMGATEEEAIMVAGFAGGIGLSGNGCGALGAAVFMSALTLRKKRAGKPVATPPDGEELLNRFYEAGNFRFLCREISGQEFSSIDDHTKYVKNGGCAELIDALTQI